MAVTLTLADFRTTVEANPMADPPVLASVTNHLIESDAPDSQLERWLSIASALVVAYAPDAPDDAHNEALVRLIGYWAQMPAAGIRSETIGDVSFTYQASGAAMTASGAADVLLAGRVWRGGVVQ